MSKEDYTIKEKLYKYSPSGYCGVYVPRHVMKRLAKITTKFEQEVREILRDNKDELYASNWNLAYPNGEQTAVFFADKEGVDRRISLFKARQPEVDNEVYLAEAHGETAKAIIEQIENEATLLNKGETNNETI